VWVFLLVLFGARHGLFRAEQRQERARREHDRRRRRRRRRHGGRGGLGVGFGRIVVSETDAPNMLVNLV
jgi:hypothetical protein